MKLFGFSDVSEGEDIILGWVNIRRFFHHGKKYMSGLYFGVALPFPVKQTHEDFSTMAEYISWRVPCFSFKVRKSPYTISWSIKFGFWMTTLKHVGVMPTREMIADGIDDGLTPEERLKVQGGS